MDGPMCRLTAVLQLAIELLDSTPACTVRSTVKSDASTESLILITPQPLLLSQAEVKSVELPPSFCHP